jgi:hypothetical protein
MASDRKDARIMEDFMIATLTIFAMIIQREEEVSL